MSNQMEVCTHCCGLTKSGGTAPCEEESLK